MPIINYVEKKQLPVAPWKGYYLDGISVPGGLSKAENIIILPDGSAERRAYERTLSNSYTCLASRGLKDLYELSASSGTRYLYADIDKSDTAIASFGSELITHFASWTDPGASWAYGSSVWTHSSGTTSLAATGEPAVVAASPYRVVVDVTCNAPSSAGTGWAFTSTDSTFTWTSDNGNSHVIWLKKWTHSAGGGTTALTALPDFTVVAGETYRVTVHVTHTSGTSLTVLIGGKTAGVITATGLYTYVVPFVTDATALRFVPTDNWVGYVSKAWPQAPNKLDDNVSVKKFINPAGANVPSNLGPELVSAKIDGWYPEAAASSGQSLSVYLGNTLAGTITASGVYTYDVTTAAGAPGATALTFTPTTAWDGTLNSASVKTITYSGATTKLEVIGAAITGTTELEAAMTTLVGDLISTGAVPQWAAMQDTAFRVDGVNQNYKFTDASGSLPLGVMAPPDAPVTANTTGGELTAGDYNVYYTYVRKIGTYVVEGNPSPVSPTTVSGNAITVNVIACQDNSATHIRIYRTLYNEPGSDAYLDQEVPNATATITITQADDYIGDGTVLEFDHDAPPIGKFVLGAGSRLWLMDTDGVLHWSRLYEPELFPALSIQSFDPKDGDTVMGMCALKSNILVFKKRRTWTVNMFSESTDDAGNAMLAKDIVSSNIGCISSGTIQTVGTDGAIWLSSGGFIMYDGGTIRNISAGDPQSGQPSRIQSVINDYLFHNAASSITSAFHSKKHLYHVNLLYRADDGATITAQRYFVYNLDNDTWTEFTYNDTAGASNYITSISLAHDSYGNEILLLPYITSTVGTSAYIYQTEYDEGTSSSSAVEILTNTGADGQTFSFLGGAYTFHDSADSVFIVDANGCIFKVTWANAKSCILNTTTIRAFPWPDTVGSGDTIQPMNCIYDYGNGTAYIQLRTSWDSSIQNPGSSVLLGHCIFKITTSGVVTQLSMDTISGSYVHTKLIGINTTDNILYVLTWDNYRRPADPTYFRLCSMNQTTGALTTIYSFTGITASMAEYFSNYPFIVSDNALYYFHAGNMYVLGDIDGVPAMTVSAVPDITATYLPIDLYVRSATEIYLVMTDSTKTYIYFYKLESGGSGWIATQPIDNGTTVPTYYAGTGFASRTIMIHENDLGYFIIEGLSGYPGFATFAPEWNLLGVPFISADWPYGATDITGISWPENTANVFVGCGREWENAGVWRVTLYYSGTVNTIVCNYEDLGIAEEKRTSRAYLDTSSIYTTIGTMSIEPNYNIKETVHVDDETTEPDGSVSRLTFTHLGQKDWYTSGDFDSTVEVWRTHRIDIGVKSQSFRYCIILGDFPGGSHGQARIRPPKIVTQILPRP